MDLENTPDEVLIANVVNGDDASFEKLVKKYEYTNHPTVELYIIGGKWKKEIRESYGQIAEEDLKKLKLDKAFIGLSSFTAKDITVGEIEIAKLKQIVIENSKETIGLADSSKFGKELFAYVSPISALKCLISDDMLPVKIKNQIENSGPKVILVAK